MSAPEWTTRLVPDVVTVILRLLDPLTLRLLGLTCKGHAAQIAGILPTKGPSLGMVRIERYLVLYGTTHLLDWAPTYWTKPLDFYGHMAKVLKKHRFDVAIWLNTHAGESYCGMDRAIRVRDYVLMDWLFEKGVYPSAPHATDYIHGATDKELAAWFRPRTKEIFQANLSELMTLGDQNYMQMLLDSNRMKFV